MLRLLLVGIFLFVSAAGAFASNDDRAFGQAVLSAIVRGDEATLTRYVGYPMSCADRAVIFGTGDLSCKNPKTPSFRQFALQHEPLVVHVEHGSGSSVSSTYFFFVPRESYRDFVSTPGWKNKNWISGFFGCVFKREGGRWKGAGDFCFTESDGPFDGDY
jgi:hypothetical protein